MKKKELVSRIFLSAIALVAMTPMAWSQAEKTSSGQPSMFEALFPFVIMFVILYFLLLRPQMKKQKEHQSFVTSLKRGDEVITQSGILGKIEGLTDQFVTLEIADGVSIKMLRTQVAGSAQSAIRTAQKEGKS